MKTIIYYFSGTGNSLQAARDLALRLDAAVIPVTGFTEADLSCDAVGIVFPVYLWGVPQIVLQFIEKLKNGRKDRYFFAIATYKSDPGGAIDQMSRKLNRLGIKLSAGFTIAMPGNNIIFYDPEPEQEQVRKLNELKLKAAEIAEAVSCKKEILPASSAVDRILKTGLLNSLISCTFKNSDRRFRTVSTCSRCGTCVQVCAAGNIRLVDGHPVWQHHCQQCTACINLCPKNAIQSGKSTVGRQRYKNPDVDIWDLSHRST